MLGLAINLPFMILEWATQSDLPRSNFPMPLFIAMWAVAAIFVALTMSIAMLIKKGGFKKTNKVVFFLKIIFAFVLANAWIELVIDQMPCFLGASGC